MEQLLEKRQATSTTRDRALQRRMLHIARIMSGELTGFGSKVKKVIIDPAGKACTDGQVVHIPQRMVEDDTHNIIM